MKDIEILDSPIRLDWIPHLNGYVIIIAFDRIMRFFMIKHSSKNRHWEFPGGKIEKDENIIEAGIREFLEETGKKLDKPILVAKIQNYYSNGEFHSTAWLISGVVLPNVDISIHNGDEIIQCKAFNNLPRSTTFSKKWNELLILTSHSTLENYFNKLMWELNSEAYNSSTFISSTEVHYGPLIPGEHIFKLLPKLKGKRVLDLGCGQGHNLSALKNLGALSGVGVDFSPRNILEAQKLLNSPKFEFLLENYLNLSSDKIGKFDLIISIFSISFIRDLNAFFKVLAELSQSNTTIVLSTDHPNRIGSWTNNHLEINNYFWPRNKIRRWQIGDNNEFNYFHYTHSFESIINALVKANFHIVKIWEPASLPKNNLKNAPYSSAYFLNRHFELLSIPYTLIVKAKYK